jgi:hypothetical protein
MSERSQAVRCRGRESLSNNMIGGMKMAANYFKFDLGQKVNAGWRGKGVVICQLRRSSGNYYEVKFCSDGCLSCDVDSTYVEEERLLPSVDLNYPCPDGGVRAFMIFLDRGDIVRFFEDGHMLKFGSCSLKGDYHCYKWDIKKGTYYIDLFGLPFIKRESGKGCDANENIASGVNCPCPNGISRIQVILDTSLVRSVRSNDSQIATKAPYHIYKWDSIKGVYYLDGVFNCCWPGEELK